MYRNTFKRPMTCALLALVAITTPPAHAENPPPATSSATTNAAAIQRDPTERVIRGLINGLSSPDYAERQKAQQQLDKLNHRARPLLRRIAAETEDPECKTRLLQRADALDELCALNPPPISIDLQNADGQQLIAALKTATGVEIAASIEPESRFTLHARELPFWEVFRQISAQSGMLPNYNTATAPFALLENNQRSLKDFSIDGPYIFAIMELSRRRIIQVGKDNRMPHYLELQYLFAADPRLNIVRAGSPQILSVKDDANNELIPAPPEGSSAFVRKTHGPFVRCEGTSLAIPANLGTRIASIKGTIRFEIALAEERATISSADAAKGEPVTLGPCTITVRKWQVVTGPNGSLDMDCELINSPSDDAVTFSLIDAHGKTVEPNLWRGTKNHFKASASGNLEGPLSIDVRLPTKTKTVDVPLALNNIPLP